MSAAAVTPTPLGDLDLGCELTRAGRITEALRAFGPGPHSDPDPLREVTLLAALLECRLARGEMGQAAALGHRIRALAGPEGLVSALAAVSLGDLATAEGHAELAASRYLDAGSCLGDRFDDPILLPWRAGAALALTRTGRHREAHALALEHLERAWATGSARALALALRTVATTTTKGGRVALLREARAALAPVRADRLAAQIDTDLAALLVLQGDDGARAEAVALLRTAERYAGREDLFPLADRVRRLLERLGEEPRRIRSELMAELTTTQQRAARLAIDGLTNRQIAETLSVSVKAVEWHLSHVYRKLGIHSRTGLAESLGIPA